MLSKGKLWFIIVSLVFFGFVANVNATNEVKIHDASPLGSYRFDVSGPTVAWVDYGTNYYAEWGANGSIWYENINTGIKKKIADTSEYQPVGIKVLNDGIYFGTKGSNAGLFKYDFTSQKITQIIAITNIGELEKQTDLIELKIINNYFFEYTLGDKIHSSTRYIKYYNLNTKKAFGITKVEELSNSGGVSFDAVKNNEIINIAGDPSGLSFSHKTYIGGKYLFFAVSEPGSSGQFSEYRIKNLSTDEISQIKLATKQTEFNLSDSDSGGDYLIAQFINSNTFLRFNFKKGELGATIIKTVHSSVGTPYTRDNISGNLIVWHGIENSQESDYLYNAENDQKCKIDNVESFALRLTEGYIYWQGEGNTLYGRAVVCKNSTDKKEISQPVNKQPSNTPEISSPILNSLIKSKTSPAVYYLGNDNKRYVFFNTDTYLSWYRDFSSVKVVTPEKLAEIRIGGNVTYYPGTLVKIETDPRVYAVDHGGVLRWVKTEAAAKSLFGSDWNKKIKTVPDFLFVNYKLGNDIQLVGDFNIKLAQEQSSSIGADKGL